MTTLGIPVPPQQFCYFSTGMSFLALLKGNLFSRVCNGAMCCVFSSA